MSIAAFLRELNSVSDAPIPTYHEYRANLSETLMLFDKQAALYYYNRQMLGPGVVHAVANYVASAYYSRYRYADQMPYGLPGIQQARKQSGLEAIFVLFPRTETLPGAMVELLTT